MGSNCAKESDYYSKQHILSFLVRLKLKLLECFQNDWKTRGDFFHYNSHYEAS